MDGRRFDRLARSLVTGTSRRGVLGGLLGIGAGLAGIGTTGAVTCPPGRVFRRGVGCVCRLTGRPPVGGVCPCSRGQTDTGDGRGCLACRAAADCANGGFCEAGSCVLRQCLKTSHCQLCDGDGLCTTADTTGLSCGPGQSIYVFCPVPGTGSGEAACCTPGVDCLNDPGGPSCPGCVPVEQVCNSSPPDGPWCNQAPCVFSLD
jgi:hypothetical protein